MISADYLNIKAESAAKTLELGLNGFFKIKVFQAVEKTYQEQVNNISWSSELRELKDKHARLEVLVDVASNLGFPPHVYISELLKLEKEIGILEYGIEGYESMKQEYLAEVFEVQASDNERLGIA